MGTTITTYMHYKIEISREIPRSKGVERKLNKKLKKITSS
jgi:hypothetical protein